MTGVKSGRSAKNDWLRISLDVSELTSTTASAHKEHSRLHPQSSE